MGMNEWLQAGSQIAAGALLASLWQGALLAAVVWAGLKLAPRTAAAIRFLIWIAAFIAIALLPVFSVLSSAHGSAMASPARAGRLSVIELDSRWALAIACLWLAFSIVRVFGLVRGAFRLRAIVKRATTADAGLAVQKLLSHAGLRRATLCTSPDVDQPCVIGFFAPRILLPVWLLEKATPAELTQIVLHEVSHLRRFDDWGNLLQKVTLACFPLHPALAWVERRLCAEREAACDERVVDATSAPREYAACLTNLAEQRLVRRSAVFSLGAWEKRSELAGRIESILSHPERLDPVKARALLAAFMLAMAAGSAKLGSLSQPVTFAAPHEIQNARAASGAGAAYRDVLLRPPSPSSTNHSPSLSATAHAATGSSPFYLRQGKRHAPSLFRAKEAEGIQSLIIVTQWQSSSGQCTTLTLIDRVVSISPPSAVHSQSGWYVVQL